MNPEMKSEDKLEDIEIPAGAVTTCPARSFKMVSVGSVCVGIDSENPCGFFRGLWCVVKENERSDFAKDFRVKCGFPQAREIVMIFTGKD